MQPSQSNPSTSEAGRLTGVFFSPGAVFADIAAAGRWYVAMALLIVFSTAAASLMVSRVGYDQMIRNAMENNERVQQLSAEQKEKAIEAQRKFMPIAVRVGPLVGIALGLAVIAGALLFTFRFLLDAELSFKQTLNICCYASLPPSLVSTLMMIAVLYMKPPTEFDPQTAAGFSVASFLPADTSAWLKSLTGSLDLFTFWTMALMAIGFSAFVGAKKMPFGRALTGIVVPWLVWVVGKVAFASIFG